VSKVGSSNYVHHDTRESFLSCCAVVFFSGAESPSKISEVDEQLAWIFGEEVRVSGGPRHVT